MPAAMYASTAAIVEKGVELGFDLLECTLACYGGQSLCQLEEAKEERHMCISERVEADLHVQHFGPTIQQSHTYVAS